MKLFSLKPMGTGIEMVESLTSYLARLAKEHSVTVGILVGKVIAPELGKDYLLESCRSGGSRFYEQGAGLNGLGKQADDLSTALFKLTGCDVSILTLQSWRDIFPATGLLRKYKAWCPLCLEEWKKNHEAIFEPLIWNFKQINVCGNHGVSLNTRCPLCGLEIPILSRKVMNGYCSFCGCWLGSSTTCHAASQKQSTWDLFALSNISYLLKDEMIARIPANSIKDFIGKLINETGGLTAFSQCFSIPKSTVSEWHNGLHKPSLYMILKLCYSLGINISSVINSSEQPYSSSIKNDTLVMSSKSKMHRRKIDWNAVESILKIILDNSASYTPSLRQVARELNIDKRLLYYHFPLWCKEISKNYTSQIKLMKNKRLENGCEKIREAIILASCAGENPSRRNIEKVLPTSVILREETFKDYWKDLIR